MDLKKFKQKCIVHSEEYLQYIKIIKPIREETKNLFCCQKCFESDSTLDRNDYERIDYFISSDNDCILTNWPPVENKEILEQLMCLTSSQLSLDESKDRVNQFFNNFKSQILDSIDNAQQQWIRYVEINYKNSKNIISQYQEISNISELRSYLLDNKTNFQTKCNNVLQSIKYCYSSQSYKTQKLKNLFDMYNQDNFSFDLNYYQEIQQQTLKTIENLQNPVNKFNIEILNTEYNKGFNHLEITKNSKEQQYVKLNKIHGLFLNAVSDIVLKSNNKYVFRFQIDNLQQGEAVYIGLIQDDDKDYKRGFLNKLSCRLENQGKFICKDGNYGIQKQLKGNGFQLGENNELEMRLCIAENTLEMLDYPKYNYKIGLDDEYISNLVNGENLRIYLGFIYLDSQVTLTQAMVVKKFDQ